MQDLNNEKSIVITIKDCNNVIVFEVQNYFWILEYSHTRKEEIVYFVYFKSVITIISITNVKIKQLIDRYICNICDTYIKFNLSLRKILNLIRYL